MINFFRKIRKQLADDNKPIKYMRYAIGEIVLVVIGILIALQVNNWNEQKKINESTFQILEEVEDELIHNIREVDARISLCRAQDSIFNLVNKKELTLDDYKTSPWLLRFFRVQLPLYIVDDSFKNLIQTEGVLTKEYKSLVVELKSLYGKEKRLIEEVDRDIKITMDAFMEEIKFSKKWYSNYKSVNYLSWNDEMFLYFLNDPTVYNFSADMTDIAVIQTFQQVQQFKIDALRIYEKIHQMREKYEGHSLESKYTYPNPDDFKHYVGSYTGEFGVTNISIDNDRLVYEWRAKNSEAIKMNIFPSSRTNFTIGLNDSFYTLILDADDNVISKRNHLGWRREEQKKDMNK